MKSLQHIKAIRSITSSNEKAKLLETALQCPESELLPILFDIAMNYKINTFITTLPVYRAPRLEETDMSRLDEVIRGIHSNLVAGTRYTKDEWNSMHIMMMSWTTEEDGKILESIMTKDFTIGLAVKSYNKVALKLGKNQIPFYDTMRVSSINDADIDYEKGAYIGLKKDGVNATVERNATIISRNGQIICLSHIEEILKDISNKYAIFGELVSTTRQSSSGLVNSAVKLQYASKLPVHELELHVFDAMPIEEYESKKFKMTFEKRIKLAEDIVNQVNNPLIKFVEQQIVYSKEEALVIYEHSLSIGEEGIIVNDSDAIFEIKRTKKRGRCKAELSAETRIIGTTVHNKRADWIGSLTVTSEDGVVSDVGSGLTEEMMKDFFINSPINKVITINYNAVIPNQTGDGWTFFLPTIGRDKSLRFDKDELDSVIPKQNKEK